MTSTVDRPTLPSPAHTHRVTLVILAAVFLAGVLFIVQAALPYFSISEARFGGYWPRRWWLLAHIVMGMVALLSGPVQLWLGLSDQRLSVHRRLGYVYMTSVALSAAAGYYLAFNTDFGLGFGAGLAGLATAWLLTTGMAFMAVRRQLYDQHKEWMIRSYVVTAAFVVFRIIFPVIQNSGVGSVTDQLATAAWTAWAIPLLLTEAILQGRKMLNARPI